MADDDHAISYLALKPGVPVISADGAEVGTVHRVLDNAREHIFDGIVLRTDSGMRFVDAPEVDRITLRQVTLTIDAADGGWNSPSTTRASPSPVEAVRRRWWQRGR